MSKVNTEGAMHKWTENEVAKLSEMYVPQDNSLQRSLCVEKLVQELGRSKRSVIGKLVHMGVYVAPEKPSKAKKDEGPTKGEILQTIADSGFEVEGLESATKSALLRLKAFVEQTK